MFLFLPYRTDAYETHFPFGTALVIALNVAVGLGMATMGLGGWVLEFGEISPTQWIPAAFTHAGWMHLIGNMIFLWCFGQVVEGTVGTVRFLLFYLVTAAVQGLVYQLAALGEVGGAVGASGVVFGLLGAALLWAPRTRVRTFTLVLFRPFLNEMSLPALGAVFAFLELLFLAVDHFQLGTAFFHVVGGVIGAGLAFVILKAGWVDCGGWDYVSLRHRRS